MNHQPSREESLFDAAAALATPQERAALLDRECRGDLALRAAVESLLRASEAAGEDFLSPSSIPAAARPATKNSTPREPGPTPPSVDYLVGGEIARGGMGAVLEAEDRRLGRKVAMKVMRLEASANADARNRFVREATVLARLEHPNIVPIHELGWDAENRPFYTMKLVQGRTLQAVLNGLKQGDAEFVGQYTLDRLLTIFRKICDALALAHARGVIHRDLKPENVMVGEFGEVLVMDWGIAKILDNAASVTPPEGLRELAGAGSPKAALGQTLDGTVMGTPHYMSPEQAGGRVSEMDAQSDVFALGAILYVILTLHPPVEADTASEVIERIKRGEIRPPTDYNSTTSIHGSRPVRDPAKPKKFQTLPHCPRGRVPAALSAVTMRALALDKAKRYSTVPALAADIEAYQGGFATSAEAAGIFTQLLLLVRRHQQGFAVGAAAWLIITVLAVWFIINLRASEHQAQLDKEAERRALAKTQIALADSAFRNTDLPGMLRALEACPADLRDQSWRYLYAKRDGSLRALQIPGWEGPMDVLAVPGKPGQFLLCNDSEELGMVDVGTDKIIRTIKTGYPGRKRFAFSDDGRWLAVAPWPGHAARVIDAESGRVVNTLSLPDIEPNSLALNQDGSLLAVTPIRHTSPYPPSMLLDVRSGRVLWSIPKMLFTFSFTRDGRHLLATAGSPEREFLILDTGDGRQTASVPAYASTHALSPDGRVVALGTFDGQVLLLDAQSGVIMQRAQLFTARVEALAWTTAGLLLAEGRIGRQEEGRRVFRLLDAPAWTSGAITPIATLFGLPEEYRAFWSLQPDSGELVTVGLTLRLWRIPVGREWIEQNHESERGEYIGFLGDSTLLGRKLWALTRYQISDDGKQLEIPDHLNLDEGYSVGAVHPASGKFALGSLLKDAPYEIRVYQSRETNLDLVLQRTVGNPVLRLEFDRSGTRMASVLTSGMLEVFELPTGRVLLSPPGNFQSAAFAGAGNDLVAVVRQSRTAESVEDHLVVLDGATGAVRHSLTNRFAISAFAVSPDRRLVAIGGSDQSVHIFDAETLAAITSFRAHDGEVSALAFHPSAPVIATGGFDRTVKLWDYTQAQLLDEFMGLGGTPVTLAFNPSGRLLAVDGEEHTSRIFKVADWTKLDAALKK